MGQAVKSPPIEEDAIFSTDAVNMPQIKLSLDTTGVDHYQHKHTQSIERISSPQRYRSSSISTSASMNEELSNIRSGMDAAITSREAEKIETQAKQRDNYLNIGLASTESGLVKNLNFAKFIRSLFTNIDSHTEHLYYILAVECFCLFLTFLHYPYLDKKNKFLTPIVTGGQTSLLGETLRQIYSWRETSCIGNLSFLHTDEEKNIDINALKTPNQTHKRTPSTTSTVANMDVTDACIREHLKFLIWGGINGLFSSYWIDFLVSLFSVKIFCVFLDQTVGTIFFQSLYFLFICLWDGEMEVDSSGKSKKVDLTWDVFYHNYSSMIWKYMKLSWLVWPWVSIVSFTSLPSEWIFPLNCVFSAIFTVLLGI